VDDQRTETTAETAPLLSGWLTRAQVAAEVGVSVDTLQRSRHRASLCVVAQSLGRGARGVGDGTAAGSPQPAVGIDGARQGGRGRRACRADRRVDADRQVHCARTRHLRPRDDAQSRRAARQRAGADPRLRRARARRASPVWQAVRLSGPLRVPPRRRAGAGDRLHRLAVRRPRPDRRSETSERLPSAISLSHAARAPSTPAPMATTACASPT
jgi:hypothetical protein